MLGKENGVGDDQQKLEEKITSLEQDNKSLRETVATLKERWENYRPIILAYAEHVFPRVEIERIMAENKWFTFEEVLAAAENSA